MISDLPIYIISVFVLTTLVTVFLFYWASKQSNLVLFVLLSWLAIQAIVAYSEFYLNTTTVPPRFILLVSPAIFVILLLFLTKKGKSFIDGLDLKMLTLIHIIRIPVELVLYWLFLEKQVPELMTFEGRNFDIISGITAPIIYYFAFISKKLNNKILLVWNFICLALLFNIVANAVLSAPSTFQQFAFDQPNVAVLHFPFVWLPCCIVPLVLLSHLASIRRIISLK